MSCPHCRGKSFRTKHTTLAGRWLAMFDLEGLAETTTTYICQRCGFVQVFADYEAAGKED